MVEIACECGDGFGVPHSHVFDRPIIITSTGRKMLSRDTGEVRIWVDWREVARNAPLVAGLGVSDNKKET